MSITSRRRAKLIGGALFAASLAAGSFATTPVSADIGDSVYNGFIRVKPTAPTVDWEDQAAPVIMAGATSAAASVQLNIPSDWESGDKITLQVQADNNVNLNGHETNCLSAAQSISFAGPYVVADVAVSGAMTNPPSPPYPVGTVGAGWGYDTAPLDHNPGTDGGDTPGDPRTPDPDPSVAPTFNVALTTSPSCGGVGVTDQIELTFSNSATADGAAPGFFELTFNNIRYNVGALVPTGPVHVIPFARQAVDSAPGTFADNDLFGGNLYSTATGLMWTNNAFISPVTIAATGTPIVADGTIQPLGSITLSERAVNALLDADNHYVCVSGVTLASAGTATMTGGTTPTVAATVVAGSCIQLALAGGGIDSAINVITITGITGSTNIPGTLMAALTVDPDGPGGLTADNGAWMGYLSPDDQNALGNADTDDSNELYTSDVNSAVGTVYAFFAMAVGLPDRIGGNDRYETSSKIAANVTMGDGLCTEVAVITSGNSFADSLSANYLAGALSARAFGRYEVPVLLVTGDTLPQTTAQFLSWAGVGHVYIVGGTAAVSSGIEAQLANTLATNGNNCFAPNWVNNQKIQVTRVAGGNRYATNRAAANLGSDLWGMNNNWNRNRIQLELVGPAKRTAIVATGTGFADALAAGPVAYRGMPLILTDGASLSADALGTLQDLDIEQVIIIGGTAAVSDAVRAQISGLGILTGRVAGANRYATATAWATFARGGCAAAAVAGEFDCALSGNFLVDGSRILLASGTNFADALSGGPLGAVADASIVLTNPATLSPETAAWLTANALALSSLTVLGLGQAVSTAAMNAASAAISVA